MDSNIVNIISLNYSINDLNMSNTPLDVQLKLLIQENKIDELRTYFQAKSNPISKPLVQQLFFYSVSLGREGVIDVLLQNGAKINDSMPLGDTALIWAILKNHTHLIPLLIKYGANVNLPTISGRTALDYAIKQNLQDAISLLIQAGATQSDINNDHLKIRHGFMI